MLPNVRYYRCVGEHLVKDYSQQPPPRRLLPMERLCKGCCVKNLSKDCLIKLASAPMLGIKANLNYNEVISSLHKKEGEVDRRSFSMIIRSKSKKDNTICENKEIQTRLLAKKKKGRKP